MSLDCRSAILQSIEGSCVCKPKTGRMTYLLLPSSAPDVLCENEISGGQSAQPLPLQYGAWLQLALALSHPLQQQGVTYLGVYGEGRGPILWWNYLAYAVLATLWSDLFDVFHGVSKFFLGRPEGWRILQTMRSNPLVGFPNSHWVTSPLDSCHIEGSSPTGAEGDVGSICGILAAGGGILGEIEVGRAIGTRWLARLGYCSGGRAPTRRRRDHHGVKWTVESSATMKVDVVHSDGADMSGMEEYGGYGRW